MSDTVTLGTRARLRPIQPSRKNDPHPEHICVTCERPIVYVAPGVMHNPKYEPLHGDRSGLWVVCNIYKGRGRKRRWDRLEGYHPYCYTMAGEPYGPPDPYTGPPRIN